MSHGGISKETEQKIFMTEVFPRISQLCRGLGLSFEVVDVGYEAAGTKIAIHHMLDALKTSLGTAFVVSSTLGPVDCFILESGKILEKN